MGRRLHRNNCVICVLWSAQKTISSLFRYASNRTKHGTNRPEHLICQANRSYGSEERETLMASTSTTSPKVSFTGRLAGFTARHAWLTLGAWVLVLVASFLLAGQMNLTGDAGSPAPIRRVPEIWSKKRPDRSLPPKNLFLSNSEKAPSTKRSSPLWSKPSPPI